MERITNPFGDRCQVAQRGNDLQPGPRIIVFDYQAGRSGAHARQFLSICRLTTIPPKTASARLPSEKNWLFVSSERAQQRAAAIQSLLGTAKLNGLNPATWLKDTLEKLPTWPNSRIDELLPLNTAFLETVNHN